MDAVIVDRRGRQEEVGIPPYLDQPWSSRPRLDDLGHERARAVADAENQAEGWRRFAVRPAVPRVGSGVTLEVNGLVRKGTVVATRVGRTRVKVRVVWTARNGQDHEHWYDARALVRRALVLVPHEVVLEP